MLNSVILMGRLTKSPELKKTPSDISVCSFTIAVERRFDKEKTDFINVVTWRQTAEFVAKYFTKGQMIAVMGEIQNREYEKDGQKRTITEVVASQVSFCGDKAESKTEKTENIEFEELPF